MHLSADDQFAGKLMRCPTCRSAQTVPAQEAVAAAAPMGAPPVMRGARPSPVINRAPSGRKYGFNCPYCSSRLNGNESMAGQDGQCPTCGKTITIPILDKYGRLIDPKTRQIIKQDPHPVHAYAAAGERAPKIIRLSDGGQHIQCSQCGTYSSISSNNCRQCGMPFTMEGTTAEAAGHSNNFCVASLVLGIVSIPTFCFGLLAPLAILFGIIGYNQVSKNELGRGKGMALAGIICGLVGGVCTLLLWFR